MKVSLRLPALLLPLLMLACSAGSLLPTPTPTPPPTRQQVIPADAHKYLPADDLFPPVIHLAGYAQPVPMPGAVNTAGAEDSPFFSADGSLFFFFFTPDVRQPASKQVIDGVSGIWWMTWNGAAWSDPQRARLSSELALDGCPFYQEGLLWFCSVRAGSYREIDFYTARLADGAWQDWRNAGEQLNQQMAVGELHISRDGSLMIFHKPVEARGDLDLYQSQQTTDGWGEPLNLGSAVNTTSDEGWPYLTPDGLQLWFTRPSALGYPGPAVWRLLKQAQGWGEPEEIISSYAGEPTLDTAGNIYFVHHFFSADGQMLEADIYVAYKE